MGKKFFLYSSTDVALLDSPAFYPSKAFLAYENDAEGGYRLAAGLHGRDAVERLFYRGKNAVARKCAKALGLPRSKFYLKSALREITKSHCLLPTCPFSAAMAIRLGFEVTFPGELLDESFLRPFDEYIREKLSRWHNAYKWQGHWTQNWLKEGIFHIYLIMQSHELSKILGERLAREGVEEIQYISRPPKDGKTSPCAADIPIAVWNKMFPEKMKPVAVAPRESLFSSEAQAMPTGDDVPEGAVAFCFAVYEVKRMLPFIRETVLKSKRKVIVCYYDSIGMINNYKDVPLLVAETGAQPVYIDAEACHARFGHPATSHKLAASAAEHFTHADAHEDYWRYLEEWLWPRYESLLAWFSDFMKRKKPVCCFTAETLLVDHSIPRMAASRLGIPTLGLPHAYDHHGFPLLEAVDIEHFICTMPFQSFMISHNNSIRSVPSFRQLNLENEYICDQAVPEKMGEKRVLFFHTIAQVACDFHFNLEPKRHIGFLKSALSAIPPHISSVAEVVHKGHPGNPDAHTLELAGISKQQLLPLRTTAKDALATADVTVSYNYAGSPFLQGIRWGVPSLLFIDEAQPFLKSHGAEHQIAKVREYGLILVTTSAALWDEVDKLLHNDVYREEILARQRRFHEEMLIPERDDWGEWLEEVITKGSGASCPAG